MIYYYSKTAVVTKIIKIFFIDILPRYILQLWKLWYKLDFLSYRFSHLTFRPYSDEQVFLCIVTYELFAKAPETFSSYSWDHYFPILWNMYSQYDNVASRWIIFGSAQNCFIFYYNLKFLTNCNNRELNVRFDLHGFIRYLSVQKCGNVFIVVLNIIVPL